MATIKRELSAWVDAHGWAPGEDAYARLDVLLELWLRYAPVLNLTGARDRAGMLAHVRDGLETVLCAERAEALTGGVGDESAWVDVGSGGGFPGLVVAACARRPVVLVEPREKRAAFLALAGQAIETDSIEVIRGRLDGTTWNEKLLDGVYRGQSGHVGVTSARAVFDPSVWLERGTNVVSEGGVVVVHASRVAAPLPASPLVSVEGTFGAILGFLAVAKVDQGAGEASQP